MIRLQNEPKLSPNSELKRDALTIGLAITELMDKTTEGKSYPLTALVTAVLTSLNYSVMPGVMEMLAGEQPRDNPPLDTLRFTALFLHNMILNGQDHKHSTYTIIEHTTREYAVRYEMLSDVGEKILKRMQEAR